MVMEWHVRELRISWKENYRMIKKSSLSFILGIVVGILVGFGIGFLCVNPTNKDVTTVVSKEELDNEEILKTATNLDAIKEDIDGKDVFKVTCVYCDIYYPAKWEDNVLIEETLNVVQFSADFGDGKVIPLFDVVAMELSETEKDMEVHIIKYDLEFNEQWTDEEKQMVMEMQKDADCVAEYLEKENITVIM